VKALRLACWEGGGTAILVGRGIDHYVVPVLGLPQLEATAIHIMLASSPVKILALYLSPSQPLIRWNLSACLRGGLSVLMTGDLNTKLVDWNSQLPTSSDRFLRDYADEHSCLIYRLDSPTSVPYNSSATPDIRDISTKGLNTPVYLTACSALPLHHLPVLIEKSAVHLSLTYQTALITGGTTVSNLGPAWETRLPRSSILPNEVEINTCEEDLSSAIVQALAASTPKSRPRDHPRPQEWRVFRMKYA
jgi:hypothetical protein